jgi:hypothetical protein
MERDFHSGIWMEKIEDYMLLFIAGVQGFCELVQLQLTEKRAVTNTIHAERSDVVDRSTDDDIDGIN